jgi:lactose/L-arabinose transport system substrate-binding protein
MVFSASRILSAFAAGAMIASSGCSKTPPVDQSLTVPNKPPQQLQGDVVVWSHDTSAKSLTAILPAFNKRYPHVKVHVIMTGARLKTRFMLALAAGVGAPDVMDMSDYDAPRYIATERLTDLTTVAAKYQQDFPASVWTPCTSHGHVYGVPWDTSPCAVYYKRGLFEKYGIDADKIDTWDDYIRAGQQIVARSHGQTKMLPLGLNDLEPMFELLVQEGHGQYFDSQGRIAINSLACRRALDILRRLRLTRICSDVPAFSQDWMAGFNDESIASYPGAVWMAGSIKDTVGAYAGKKPDWRIFRLPAIEPGGLRVADAFGSCMVIPTQCRNKDAAWAFIQYALCTVGSQSAHYKNFSIFPAYLPALKTAAVQSPDLFFGGQQAGQLFSTDLTRIPVLRQPASWVETIGYVSQALSHWAASGMPNDDEFFSQLENTLHVRLHVDISPESLSRTGRSAA